MKEFKKLPFTKMHGAGNDYIYINCFAEKFDTLGDINQLAVRISDRHFGVGSDGLVLILPSQNDCDVQMRMFNSDGSEAEMCGNATRCVAKYVFDHQIVNKTQFNVETKAGVKTVKIHISDDGLAESVTVNMGKPKINSTQIPTTIDNKIIVNYPLMIDNEQYNITCVNMGNPHCIIYVDDVNSAPVEQLGFKIENLLSIFPQKTNVEFAHIVSKNEIQMRVWERGAGETLACGTGACATLVASCLNGFTDRTATLVLKGGKLKIEWNQENDNIYMTGPAEYVFEGNYYL